MSPRRETRRESSPDVSLLFMPPFSSFVVMVFMCFSSFFVWFCFLLIVRTTYLPVRSSGQYHVCCAAMLFRHESNCAVELRHLRYFLAVGEALKTPASAVPEKRARAYPFDPISAGSHYPLQLQEAWDQPPRVLLVIRPLGITRHARLWSQSAGIHQSAGTPSMSTSA